MGHCKHVMEIPRCTRNMNCPMCGWKAVMNYHTCARVVSVAWLASFSTDLPPLPRCAPINRGADVPDALSMAAQADVEAHEENFGGDDVILITRNNSSSSINFNVDCCSKDQEATVASALANSRKPSQSVDQAKKVCKICMENTPCIVMRPCNHGGLCEACMRHHLRDNRERACPYCRGHVQKVLKLDMTAATVVKARVLDI